MFVVPTPTPETTPVPLMVATPVLPDDHVPPLVASLSVVVALLPPGQRKLMPVMGAGEAFTVTSARALQPVDRIYEIVTMPVLTPATKPLPPVIVMTVAVPVLLLLQPPPAVALLSVVVVLSQMVNAPVSGAGSGFTVSTLVR